MSPGDESNMDLVDLIEQNIWPCPECAGYDDEATLIPDEEEFDSLPRGSIECPCCGRHYT